MVRQWVTHVPDDQEPREPATEELEETGQRVVDSPDMDDHNRRIRDGEYLLADIPPTARVLKNLRDRRRVIE